MVTRLVNKTIMQLFITANSPGELAGWVLPVVERLKRDASDIRVNIVLTPCQYASGQETRVTESWYGIDNVVQMGSLMRDIIFNRKSYRNTDERNCVLFLGGDAFYSAILSWLLGAPGLAYLSKPRWRSFFAKFLVADLRTRSAFTLRGVKDEQIEVVGQLCLDSLKVSDTADVIRERLKIGFGDGPVITFLPGSRPAEIEFMFPFFMNVAEHLSQSYPKARFTCALSPFADMGQVARLLGVQDSEVLRGRDVFDVTIAADCRLRITTTAPHDVMSVSDLVVTIPGTNNLQVAAMGVPLLVTVPLNKAELIPLDGILGLLNPRVFPLKQIKRHMVFKRNDQIKFVSLPNMIADRLIVPEMRGVLEPADVAEQVCRMIDDVPARVQMSKELRELTSEKGAADRIAKLILGYRKD